MMIRKLRSLTFLTWLLFTFVIATTTTTFPSASALSFTLSSSDGGGSDGTVCTSSLSSSAAGMATKRVLVIGSSGSGKSTLINALIGYDKMKTSSDATGCTGSYSSVTTSHKKIEYQLIDTVGFNEPDGGTVDKSTALAMLFKFLQDNQKGFHLVIFCIREERITVQSKATYELMVKRLFTNTEEPPPVIIAVGGMFLDYEKPQDWCEKNRETFVKHGFEEAKKGNGGNDDDNDNAEDGSNHFLCVSLPPQVKNPILDHEFRKVRANSTMTAWNAIESIIAPDASELYNDHKTFINLLKTLWNMIASYFGLPQFVPDGLRELLGHVQFTIDQVVAVLDEL